MNVGNFAAFGFPYSNNEEENRQKLKCEELKGEIKEGVMAEADLLSQFRLNTKKTLQIACESINLVNQGIQNATNIRQEQEGGNQLITEIYHDFNKIRNFNKIHALISSLGKMQEDLLGMITKTCHNSNNHLITEICRDLNKVNTRISALEKEQENLSGMIKDIRESLDK